jgi:hypothetical protein
MATLEILLLIFTTTGVIFSAWAMPTKIRWGLGFLLIILMVLNIYTNGIRWPMLPAFLIGIYFISKAFFNKPSKHGVAFRIIKWTGVITLLLLAWSLPTIFPLFRLPKLTGPYPVASKWLYLIDSTREETITANPRDRRELMTKIWYPTNTQAGLQDSYLLKSERIGFARKYGLPSWTLSYLSKIKTNVTINGEIATGSFPVLIFSHGYESPATNYYSFLAEMASHGFIIANINHTYESTASEFPNGQVKYNNDSFSIAHNLNPKMIELAWSSTEKFSKAKNDLERLEIVRELTNQYSGSEIVRRWANDISFVIDQLELINSTEGSPFYAKMNLSQLGAFGHSLGGAAAGQALIYDNRLQAATNWDGAQFGDVMDTVFQKPFMSLSHSGTLKTGFEINPQVYHRKSKSWFYDVTVEGTGHSNYSDTPYWVTLKLINEAGTIDTDRSVSIINKATLTFFEQHLLHKPNTVDNLSSELKELRIKTFKSGVIQ